MKNGIPNLRMRKLELERFFTDHRVSRESPVLFVPSSNPLSEEEISERYDRLNIKTDGQNGYPFEMEGNDVNCYDKHIALILVKSGYEKNVLLSQ